MTGCSDRITVAQQWHTLPTLPAAKTEVLAWVRFYSGDKPIPVILRYKWTDGYSDWILADDHEELHGEILCWSLMEVPPILWYLMESKNNAT